MERIKTPDLKPRSMPLDIMYVNKMLGMDFSREDAKEFLEMMRYGVELDSNEINKINVLIPAYRADILHGIDLVEDIAIAYGYGNFKPEMPMLGTTGRKDSMGRFSDSVGELMLGFGFQEVMTLIMTNRNDLFDRMQIPGEDATEAEDSISMEHSTARTWLIPSLMSVLEKNKNREYPQKIFEIGDTINASGKDQKKIAALITHYKANFSEMKAVFTGLLECLDLEYTIERHSHKSFIKGRCARTEFGFFGEVHPHVLENMGLETPVTGFEMDMNLIFRSFNPKSSSKKFDHKS